MKINLLNEIAREGTTLKSRLLMSRSLRAADAHVSSCLIPVWPTRPKLMAPSADVWKCGENLRRDEMARTIMLERELKIGSQAGSDCDIVLPGNFDVALQRLVRRQVFAEPSQSRPSTLPISYHSHPGHLGGSRDAFEAWSSQISPAGAPACMSSLCQA